MSLMLCQRNRARYQFFYSSLLILLTALPFICKAQFPQVEGVEILNSEDEIYLRPFLQCNEEERLLEKYASFEVHELVKELRKEDSIITCPGVRGTTRISGKRAVIASLIAENRDKAVPFLIEVVQNEEEELSGLALELLQYADDHLLQTYSALFLKKSFSSHPIERNRSLYILKRIKDAHIEKVVVKRWNTLSAEESESLFKTSSTRFLIELMLYNVQDSALIAQSILTTLKEKKLKSASLVEYLLVLRSYMLVEHNTEIDAEVVAILLKTKDPNVADYAAAVLSDSRTKEARDGLIRALDNEDGLIRAQVAKHLISRDDFHISEQSQRLGRMLSDENPQVIQLVYSALTWKKPDAEECCVIIHSLLSQMNESKDLSPQKVNLMMHFYAQLNEQDRDSLVFSHKKVLLKSIEVALNSPEYSRFVVMTTEHLFKSVYGTNEMDMTHLAFWKKQLE